MKKIFILFLLFILVFTGCTGKVDDTENTNTKETALQKAEAEKVAKEKEEQEKLEKEFKEYILHLMVDYDLMDKDLHDNLLNQFIALKEASFNQQLNIKMSMVNELRKNNFTIPLWGYKDAIEYIKDEISEKEYNILIGLEFQEGLTEEDVKKADKILNEFGLSTKELLKMQREAVFIDGIYDARYGTILRNNLDGCIDSIDNLNSNTIHTLIWDNIKLIINENYLKLIRKLEIGQEYDFIVKIIPENKKHFRIVINKDLFFDEEDNMKEAAKIELIQEIATLVEFRNKDIQKRLQEVSSTEYHVAFKDYILNDENKEFFSEYKSVREIKAYINEK